MTAKLVFSVLVGLSLGVGVFTALYARGYSYLTDNPAACANCHVMQAQFGAWLKSSHHAVAVCNDCHTPAGAVNKYSVKAENGFRHSYAFTTGFYPDSIQITPRDMRVTASACRKCHQEIVEAFDSLHPDRGETDCVRCHDSVGHLR